MNTNQSRSLSEAGASTAQEHSAFNLLVSTRSLQPLTRIISRAATSDAPVLIIGESGTGKELVARAIHEESDRSEKPFVCLNLAAVPTELAETALFGHEKGAFTGALHSSLGYCQKADQGTLFLDEIGEADLSLQSKLLRFLQNHEVQPVGAASILTVDARVVAATNRDLKVAIQEKRFREDLFYRLNVIPLSLPPLRERQADIDGLIDLFLGEFNLKYERRCQLSGELRFRFRDAHWPGNIRQLRSVIESLIILCEHDLLDIQDLNSEFIAQIGSQTVAIPSTATNPELPQFDRLKHHLIESLLEQSQGDVAQAALRMGISKATYYRWLKRYRGEVAQAETPKPDITSSDG